MSWEEECFCGWCEEPAHGACPICVERQPHSNVKFCEKHLALHRRVHRLEATQTTQPSRLRRLLHCRRGEHREKIEIGVGACSISCVDCGKFIGGMMSVVGFDGDGDLLPPVQTMGVSVEEWLEHEETK